MYLRQGNASLIGVDRVRDAANANQGESQAICRRTYGDDQLRAHLDRGGRDGGNLRTRGRRAVCGEEIGRGEDLAVGMVDELVAVGRVAAHFGDVAEAAAAAEDAAVGQEEADGVVVARDGLGRKRLPRLGRRVEELRVQDAGVVGEDDGAALAAGDEHGAVREHDGVGEAARVGHVGHALDRRRGVGLVDGDEVGARRGVRVGVVGGTSRGEDLAGLVHDKGAAHGGARGIADAGVTDGSCACCAVPVHGFTGPRLEDGALLPGKKPGVVVFAPDALVVGGEHGRDFGVGKRRPGVGGGIVNLAVLALTRARVGAANGEDAVVGERDGGLVAARHFHVRPGGEVVGLGVVEARLGCVGAALDQNPAVLQAADAGAEHVVVGIGNGALGHGAAGVRGAVSPVFHPPVPDRLTY